MVSDQATTPTPLGQEAAPNAEIRADITNQQQTVAPASPTVSLPLAYEVRLPEKLPEGWLSDLKNAIKESRKKLILTTILSSSLLTGIISTVAGYYLETKKAALELRKHDAAQKIELYDTLNNDINDFKYTIDATDILLGIAKEQREESLSAQVSMQVKAVLDQMRVVEKTATKVNDRDLHELFRSAVTPLTPELNKATQDSNYLHNAGAINGLIGICESISNKKLPEINGLIEKKKQILTAGL